MPWKAVQNHPKCQKSKPWAVVKESDGSVEGCHPSKAAANKQIAALHASEKLEKKQDEMMYDGYGPTLINAAVTSKPHLRQRGQEIKLVERDGQELVEVPLMRKGIYAHPWGGKMVFNDKFFAAMIDNHKNKVTDYPVALDFRHRDEQGSLAFLDPEDGGFLELKDNWLYAYGPPTDESAKGIIRSRKWRYSSPEFHPDYQSNLLQELEGSNGKFITLEDLTEINIEDLVTEVTMPNKKITFGDVVIELEDNGNGFVLTEAGVTALEQAGIKLAEAAEFKQAAEDAQVQVAQLEQKVTELEAKLPKKDDDLEMPPAIKLAFDELRADRDRERKWRLEEETRRVRQQVALVLEKAKGLRSGEFGYTKPFLDLLKSGLLLEAYTKADGEVIKLEGDAGVEGIKKYYRNLLAQLPEVALERVPLNGKTKSDETRLESDGLGGGLNETVTQEELDAELEAFEKF